MARSALSRIARFWRHLRQAPPEQSHVAASGATAKRLRDAIGTSCNGAYGSGGNSNLDEVLGKEIARGHKRAHR